MISSSRKLTVISGIVAAVIATVGVALTLTAPAVSKDGVELDKYRGPPRAVISQPRPVTRTSRLR